MVFLGLNGPSPRPTNNMTIRITLPRGKKNWGRTPARIIEAGAVTLAEIESTIWRLSCDQTSTFGRIWASNDGASVY